VKKREKVGTLGGAHRQKNGTFKGVVVEEKNGCRKRDLLG